MKKGITRRDFLKLTGLFPISAVAPRFLNSFDTLQQAQNKPPNVIVVVFDAFSAFDASLYGYQRETTPNLARLAERAVVYHNHYAGGNFTTPGTASLLSGMLPWKHRQFVHFNEGGEIFNENNIFSAFENYYRLACTHNPLANDLLGKINRTGNLDNYIPSKQLFLTTDGLITDLFKNDDDIASVSWMRAAKRQDEGFAYSLFFAHLYEPYQNLKIERFKPFFPRGLPNVSSDNYYLLEQAVDWLGIELKNVPQPFVSYFHLMPPHAPYKTPLDFYDYFKNDGLQFIPKPLDIFAREEDARYERLWQLRTVYDEFILYADREFGRFFDNLEKSGLLENTWVVLTSDHGEMFERGIPKHSTPVLYEPVIRIPLMIFEPGRKSRTDIYSNTSAVDILPTLLYVTGQKPVDWTEGVVLPPFGPEPDADHTVHTIQAKLNKQYKPIEIATITLVKDRYKLQYFFGYEELGGPGSERIELYDLKADPEELNNLYTTKRETATELLGELKKKIREADKPYESKGYEHPVFVDSKG
jgi:choline-sulfatase